MTEDFEQPKRSNSFEEGFRAYKEGFFKADNPYLLDNSEKFKDWNDGYEKAKAQS